MENIHIGLSCLSSHFKSQGHTTRLAVLSSERPSPSLKLLAAIAEDFEPHLIGFTAVFTQYPFTAAAVIGLPGETLPDHRQTIEVNHRVCPDRSLTSIFFPYPGTDLYASCKAQGLRAGHRNSSTERCRATLNLPGFSRRQIQRAFDWFEYRVYRGHRSRPFRLRKLLKNKVSSHDWSHVLFMRLLPLWQMLRGR